MIRRFIIKIFLVIFLIPCQGEQFQLRGIWMQATQIRDRKSAEQIAQRIASANLNAVFVLVYYWGGKSFFKTDNAPLVHDSLKDDDLFSYFIEECHKRGIKVFARFSNGQEGGRGADGLLSLHPEWQIENEKGVKARWFDLGKREVRDFELGLVSDLLREYPVDGVQLDYIRFPSRDYCYCEECRGGFRKIYDFDPSDLPCSLPISLPIHSIPLVNVVDAKILARFDTGIPAITIKENTAQGWLIFLNWMVDEASFPLFSRILLRAREGKRTIFIPLQRNGLRYEKGSFDELFALLKKGKSGWKMVGDLKQLNLEQGIILLPGLEIIGKDVNNELNVLLNRGGKIIVTIGKNGVKGESLGELLGISGLGRRMKGNHLILPVKEHSLIPMLEQNRNRRKLIEDWLNYRKELVTSFVEEMNKTIKETNSSLQLSAAVYYNKASADRVLQDWYGWLKKGIVDFVAPMAYVDDGKLMSALREWKSYDPNLDGIIPGLSIYKVVKGREVSKSKDEVMRQIEMIRREGAKGFILFTLSFLNDELVNELAKLR